MTAFPRASVFAALPVRLGHRLDDGVDTARRWPVTCSFGDCREPHEVGEVFAPSTAGEAA